jgi:hypothetical protein
MSFSFTPPTTLAIGQRCDAFNDAPFLGEGMRLVADAKHAPVIWALFRNPTPREIRCAGADSGTKLKLALVPDGRHTMFWLMDLPGVTEGWADMPFSRGLLPPGLRPNIPRTPKQGYLCTLVLLDADTRIVHALRMFSVSPKFSETFDQLCTEQLARLETFSPEAHDAEIQAAYRKWPRADAMLKHAVIVETAGIKETFG